MHHRWHRVYGRLMARFDRHPTSVFLGYLRVSYFLRRGPSNRHAESRRRRSTRPRARILLLNRLPGDLVRVVFGILHA